MTDKTPKQLHDELVRLRFEYIRLTEEQRNSPEGDKIFSIAREYSEAIRKIQEQIKHETDELHY